MTRKDHIKIAQVFKDCREWMFPREMAAWGFIRKLMGVMLKEDNNRFNSTKFNNFTEGK